MENEYTPKNNWNNWNWNGNQMNFLSKKHDINKIYPEPSCFTLAVAPRLFRKKSQFSTFEGLEGGTTLAFHDVYLYLARTLAKQNFNVPCSNGRKNVANGQSCA